MSLKNSSDTIGNRTRDVPGSIPDGVTGIKEVAGIYFLQLTGTHHM
jgi:hypothetical protein